MLHYSLCSPWGSLPFLFLYLTLTLVYIKSMFALTVLVGVNHIWGRCEACYTVPHMYISPAPSYVQPIHTRLSIGMNYVGLATRFPPPALILVQTVSHYMYITSMRHLPSSADPTRVTAMDMYHIFG